MEEEQKSTTDDREVLMTLRPKNPSELYLWQKSFIRELFKLLKKAELEIGMLKSELQEAVDLQEPSKVRTKLKNVNMEKDNLCAKNKKLTRQNEELLEKIRKYESSV